MTEQIDYDALATQLTESNSTTRPPSQVQTGTAAAAEGEAFLLREYGSDEAVTHMLRGRPKIGQPKRGASPTVRGRISEADYEAFKRLEATTGLTQSELVREAVHQLLVRRQAAS
ncbi:MAG: ribbon-helix-helix protein, CopG family [Dermatophilaceae bacterium]